MGWAAAIPALIGAAGAVGGGFLAGRGSKPKETKMQKTQRHLVDQLIASLSGGGPYSDLFNTDEAAFQKSFLDPAKSMFNNQIAPQIQQNYIAGGQQRSSGLEDQLLRAGVDLDQLLNQEYANFQGRGKDRMTNIIGSILGGGAGAQRGPSAGQDAMSSVGGYLTSPAFTDSVTGLFKNDGSSSQFPGSAYNSGVDSINGRRKGFAQDTYSQPGAY